MTPVLSLSQLPDGHLHKVKVGNYDVLLANVQGEVFAVENKCSHYHLPLDKGALCEHRLRCPFHHACFDIRTGEQLEAPGMDGLPRFEVRIEDGQIQVSEEPVVRNGPESIPSRSGAKATEPGHYTYVVVGGGTAAAYAVEAIRSADREGSILMLGEEELPPYDRTKVSKNFMQGDDSVYSLPLRDADFYTKIGVTFRAGARVQKLHLQRKEITLANDERITYDRVLMATGGKPRQLDVPGADLKGVHTIREAKDALETCKKAGKETRVVIIGGSFIGLETAMSLGKRGATITVVTPDRILFEKVFGQQVGAFVKQLHEKEGVAFQLERRVQEVKGRDGHAVGVVLDNGEELPADLVVVGIGVAPATDYVEGVAFRDDHSLTVDGHLAVHGDGAWAAGDIATYPDREGMVRIEHWKVAGQQGRIAGRNMAGSSEAYTMVPYFWTNQQGTNLRYVGHGTDYDNIVFDGTPGKGPFLAFYVKDRHVQACLGVQRDTDVAAVNELMALGKMPAVDQLSGRDWTGICRSVQGTR
ncbi:NAD/ferredoxin-dependent reductase-like protein [Neolewinella xylanilytica]|uniref:NAD/ferredoxin-dependent reductase-like protein n=1 Tax=Neolewinella xylanilytica TaxID=1514080 RepID=A0A2S6I099_9BACT|nr:FAD-dependent oxidoreductase [Neolewinella xylanilytica]PPK84284.1 NAD/ferredoxin-dependent reductase-like protein [Neolewinella xylanilytica]